VHPNSRKRSQEAAASSAILAANPLAIAAIGGGSSGASDFAVLVGDIAALKLTLRPCPISLCVVAHHIAPRSGTRCCAIGAALAFHGRGAAKCHHALGVGLLALEVAIVGWALEVTSRSFLALAFTHHPHSLARHVVACRTTLALLLASGRRWIAGHFRARRSDIAGAMRILAYQRAFGIRVVAGSRAGRTVAAKVAFRPAVAYASVFFTIAADGFAARTGTLTSRCAGRRLAGEVAVAAAIAGAGSPAAILLAALTRAAHVAGDRVAANGPPTCASCATDTDRTTASARTTGTTGPRGRRCTTVAASAHIRRGRDRTRGPAATRAARCNTLTPKATTGSCRCGANAACVRFRKETASIQRTTRRKQQPHQGNKAKPRCRGLHNQEFTTR
jgi:hypothetical protein